MSSHTLLHEATQLVSINSFCLSRQVYEDFKEKMMNGAKDPTIYVAERWNRNVVALRDFIASCYAGKKE